MSSVEKMTIRGIRSFGPDKEVVVTYYKPLTIIVGKNGCGKTTIIECLRFAITGTLPPGTSSGKYFIHDPAMEDSTETKAQIKLRFTDRSGNLMTVIRSSTLSRNRKGGGGQYKQLAGVLQRYSVDKSQKESLASKCADIDKILPDLFGVSKAIIDNVIFCHQEESNWPMMEGAVLKKRFDDIFESSRYTKALEAITKKKKEIGEKYKEVKKELEVHEKVLERSEEVSKQLAESQKKLEEIASQQVILKNELDDIDEQVDEAYARKEGAVVVRNSFTAARNLLASMKEDLDRKERSMGERLDIPLCDLDQRVSELETKAKDNEVEIEVLKERKNRLKMELGKLQADMNATQSTLGSLREKVKGAEAFKSDFNTTLRSISAKHNASTQSSIFDIPTSRRLLHEIEAKRQMAHTDVVGSQEKADIIGKKLQEELNTVSGKEGNVKYIIEGKRKNLQEVEQLKASIMSKLHLISDGGPSMEREMKKLEDAIAGSETELTKLNEKDEKRRINDAVSNTVKSLTDNDHALKESKKLISMLERDGESRLQIQLKEETLRSKQTSLAKELTNFSQQFKDVLIAAPTSVDGLVSKLTKSITERKLAMESAMNKLSQHQQKYSVADAQHKAAQSTIASDKEKLADFSRRLVDVNRLMSENMLSFDDLLVKLKEDLEVEKKKLHDRDMIPRLMKGLQKKGRDSGCCPLCSRGMSEDERATFIQVTDEKIVDLGSTDVRAKVERDIEMLAAQISVLESNADIYRQHRRMTEETIPADIKREKELHDMLVALRDDIAYLQREYEAHKENVAKADVLSPIASRLDQIHRDITALENEIRQQREYLTSSSLIGEGDDFSMTLEEARDRYDGLVETRDDLSKALNSYQQDLNNLQQRVSEAQSLTLSYKSRKMKLQEQSKEREDLEGKLKECLARETNLRSELDSHHKELPRLSNAKSEIEHKMKQEMSKMRHEVEACENVLSGLDASLASINRYIDKMEAFNRSETPMSLLSKTEQYLESLQGTMRSRQLDIETMDKEVEMKKGEIHSAASLRASLATNADYLQQVEKVKEQQKTHDEIMMQMSSIDIDKMQERLNDLQASRDKKLAAINRQRGQKDVHDQEIKRCKDELRNNKYRNIHAIHREALIKRETCEMTIKDLEKYYKALDGALMKYHTMKIGEINDSIRDLWSKVYKGEDIDKIEIRSDPDEEDVGKRSYNYRVVMTKHDCELDMRGRCSAGQKVLACIVIRLALQDSFCASCGIMALDEPTTNLDEPNKESLVLALSELIRDRRNSKNFQLIVITHDDDFVRTLGKSEAISSSGGTPFFLRVERQVTDDGRCYSRVLREEWEKE